MSATDLPVFASISIWRIFHCRPNWSPLAISGLPDEKWCCPYHCKMIRTKKLKLCDRICHTLVLLKKSE
jgi:hypothetical protein